MFVIPCNENIYKAPTRYVKNKDIENKLISITYKVIYTIEFVEKIIYHSEYDNSCKPINSITNYLCPNIIQSTETIPRESYGFSVPVEIDEDTYNKKIDGLINKKEYEDIIYFISEEKGKTFIEEIKREYSKGREGKISRYIDTFEERNRI